MIISVLKESKTHEGRVALTPEQAQELVRSGHKVLIQRGAGIISGYRDADYSQAGAAVLASKKRLIQQANLILKVKEPTLSELDWMKRGQMVFSFLHLAAVPKILKRILEKKITALAYETLQLKDGSLPLLIPMSEIAGKLAVQNGAHLLRADRGGRGVLMGGTSEVAPAQVLILGGGVVGENAAQVSMGMGATTRILDISKKRLRELKKKYGKRLKVYLSNKKSISRWVPVSDLVIGAVLIPGVRAPKLVSKKLVQKMKKGSVIVDVSVDQGGCTETSVVTSHAKPVVRRYGVLHYGVPNIPGIVPVTSTQALTKATFPYIKKLAKWGLDGFLQRYPGMISAMNCAYGKIVHPGLRAQTNLK